MQLIPCGIFWEEFTTQKKTKVITREIAISSLMNAKKVLLVPSSLVWTKPCHIIRSNCHVNFTDNVNIIIMSESKQHQQQMELVSSFSQHFLVLPSLMKLERFAIIVKNARVCTHKYFIYIKLCHELAIFHLNWLRAFFVFIIAYDYNWKDDVCKLLR